MRARPGPMALRILADSFIAAGSLAAGFLMRFAIVGGAETRMRHRLLPVGLRVLADTLIAAGSLAAGFLVRFTIALFEPHALPPAELLERFESYFGTQGPLLAATLVGAHALFGVYTRTRFYTRRSKAAVLLQSITLAYTVFLALVYFSGPKQGWIPRSTFLVAYLLTLAGSMGLRLLKHELEHHFRVEAVAPSGARRVRKVLVVGGAGYIGSVLVRDLLAGGYRVRVLDALGCGDESIRELYPNPEFELVEGDFRHVEPVVRALKGMDAVIHLGAIVGDPACAVDEDQTLETNLAATRLLAEVARASGASRLLFASTCSVYGAADHLVDERSRLQPVSLYAATKIDSERVLVAARDRNFHPVILRLATAFGWSHRPRFDLVVNLLTARAVVENKIQIFNGQQWRPFLHVRDISRAFRLAMEAPLEVVSGEIFNAGSSALNLTLGQLAEEIGRLRPGLAIEYVDNADRRDYRVSFDKIRQRLGFECRTGLAEGIREMQEALERGLVGDYRDSRYSNLELARLGARPPNGEIELTALEFAKNSRWWRAAAGGGSGEALLRNTSDLVALARALGEGHRAAEQPHVSCFPGKITPPTL